MRFKKNCVKFSILLKSLARQKTNWKWEKFGTRTFSGKVRKVFNHFLKMVLTPDFLHNIVNVQVSSKMKSTLNNASK